MEENANNLHFIASSLSSIHKFRYFQCSKSEFFHILIANKNFHVTVLLRVYFCDQFVAPGIRHSGRHRVFVNNQHGIQ